MAALSATRTESVLAPPRVALRVLSDEHLARIAAAGSDAAFAVIFERHHQALHRYCHSILANTHDAADALQNTMIKALRALSGETREITLKPWLYRIAHNESISLLRARRPDGDLATAAHIGDRATETVVQSRERLRELTADLGELTEQQRGALLMRELGGLSFSDVAGALQVSDAAAKQSVYEARRALQAMAEGRDMGCDLVRRTLSDGDRRKLRAMKMRGHLRACSGCRDFQTALHQRPTQLAALTPPLPLAAAAAMLHATIGGGGAAGTGGGLLAGLCTATKTGGALSLGAKVATIAAVTASIAGGAVYVAPGAQAPRPGASVLPRDSTRHAGRPISTAPAATRGTPETSTRTSAATTDSGRGAVGQQRQRAGSAPPSRIANGRHLPASGAGPGARRIPARGGEALVARGDQVTRRPAQPASRAADAAPSAPSTRPAATTAPAAVTPTMSSVTPAAAPDIGQPGDATVAVPPDRGAGGVITPPRPR